MLQRRHKRNTGSINEITVMIEHMNISTNMEALGPSDDA
jgi:hypothetical protein